MCIVEKVFRRESLPAVFILLFCVSANIYSQSSDSYATTSGNVRTIITNTGIIVTEPVEEKVAKEDVDRIEELNNESLEMYGETEGDGADFASDDLDDLFGGEERGDIETAVTTETKETVKVDPKNKPIMFSGSLKAELGYNFWFHDFDESTPLAKFRNILKFVGRPTIDFYVTGSLLMDFQDMENGQEMDIGLYELYFNYTLFGLVDISAGKRDISWSLSRMLDTNILDDKISKTVKNPDDVIQDVFYKRDRTTKDSKFSVTVNVPILSYGSIQGVGQYYLFDDITKFSEGNISVAGKVEGTLGKFSLSLLAMRWPSNMQDYEKPESAFGVELVSTLLGQDSNMFIQGIVHLPSDSELSTDISRAKLTTGVYKYWKNPVMLGIAFEYQGVWDENINTEGYTDFKNWNHYFASQIAWSHFIFTKKWTFGCEWYHDVKEEYGSVMPVLKIEDVIRFADFRLGIPVYYGSEKKYGLVLEVILNLDY